MGRFSAYCFTCFHSHTMKNTIKFFLFSITFFVSTNVIASYAYFKNNGPGATQQPTPELACTTSSPNLHFVSNGQPLSFYGQVGSCNTASNAQVYIVVHTLVSTGSCTAPLVNDPITNACVELTCTLPSVKNPYTNQCQSPCQGGDMGIMYFPVPAGTTATNINLASISHMCSAGCEVVMSQTSTIPFQLRNRNNLLNVAAPAEETGSFCQVGQFTPTTPNTMPAPTETTPPTKTEQDCVKKGKSFGTINGVVACYTKPNANSTTPVSNGTKSSTNSDGSVTSETKTSAIGADGQVESQITTIGIDAQGNQTTQTKTEKSDLNTFCSSNPTSPLCVAQKDPCIDNPDRAGCKEVGDVPSSSSIGTKDLPALSFSEISLPLNNSCPSSTSINLSGHIITISYDWLCQYASMFKPLVLAFAFFTASLIIIGASKRE